MAIQNHSREKLLSAIAFFAQNTRQCGKTKLFKLLYLLDFEHFRQTGRSVTGLSYNAWEMGPVPPALMAELKRPAADFSEKLAIEEIPTAKRTMVRVRPRRQPDMSHFSKRELRLLHELSEQYWNSHVEDMIEATHLETSPWHQVYKVEQRPMGPIPYEYALNEEEAEAVLELSRENEEFIRNYE